MQLELNRLSDLAVEALLALGRSDGAVSGAVVADQIGTTPEYLARVIKPLRAAGWVESTTGPQGGYRLTVGLDEISLLGLIEACEGPMDVASCTTSTHRSGDACVLHEPWHRATELFLTELETTTLGDIVR